MKRTKEWWLKRVDDELLDLQSHMEQCELLEDLPFHDNQLEKCGHFLRHCADRIAGRDTPDWPDWY